MNTTTTTKTIEELKAELAAAEAAVREQERAEREAHAAAEAATRRAAYEEAQRAEAAKKSEKLAPIAAALFAAGVGVEHSGAKIECSSTAVRSSASTRVSIEAEMRNRGSGFYARSTPTGRYVVVVGDRYLNEPAVRYPQRKDGTFNIAKIVETVSGRLMCAKARAEREAAEAAKQQSSEQLAASLNAKHETTLFTGSYEYTTEIGRNRHGRRTITPTPGHVFANIGRLDLNPEQAAVLFAALVEVRKLATPRS